MKWEGDGPAPAGYGQETQTKPPEVYEPTKPTKPVDDYPPDDWWNHRIDISAFSAGNRNPGIKEPLREYSLSTSARGQYLPILYGTAELTGRIIYVGQTPQKTTTVLAYAFCIGETDISTANIYVDDNQLSAWTDSYLFQTSIYDGSQTSPDSKISATFADTWEETYHGITYMVVTIKSSNDAAKIPNIKAILTRDDIDDWDDISQPSENPPTALFDFMTSEFGCRLDASDFTASTGWADLQTWCDETPATAKRWTFDGAVAGSNVMTVVKQISDHFHSPGPTWSSGEWILWAYRDVSSADMAFDATLGQIDKDPQWSEIDSTKIPTSVKVAYLDEGTRLTIVSADSSVEEVDHVEKSVQLPGCDNEEMALRWGDQFKLLAKHENIGGSIESESRAFEIQPGDVVDVTDLADYSAQRFRVTSWAMRPDGAILLGLQLYSASSQSSQGAVAAGDTGSGKQTSRTPIAAPTPIDHVIVELGGWSQVEDFDPDDLTTWDDNTPGTTVVASGSTAALGTYTQFTAAQAGDYVSVDLDALSDVNAGDYWLFTASLWNNGASSDTCKAELWIDSVLSFTFADSAWHQGTDDPSDWKRYGRIAEIPSGSNYELRVYAEAGSGSSCRIKNVRAVRIDRLAANDCRTFERWEFTTGSDDYTTTMGLVEVEPESGDELVRVIPGGFWAYNSPDEFFIGDHPEAEIKRWLFRGYYYPALVDIAAGYRQPITAFTSATFERSDSGSLTSPQTATIRTETADYTILPGDCTIRMDATSGALTATLPAAASSTGRIYNVVKVDSTANRVTIDANASELISGSLTQILKKQWDSFSIHCDGSTWTVI